MVPYRLKTASFIEVEVIKKSDTSTSSPSNSMEETNKEPFNTGDTYDALCCALYVSPSSMDYNTGTR